MNKKAQESGTPEMLMDLGRLVFTAVVVIILIGVGIGVWQIFYGKDTEIKKSFQTLDEEIQYVINTKKPTISTVYLSDKYDLIGFDNVSYNSGRYEKPSECGSYEYCLVVCKNGLVSIKDNCKNPIAYKKYGPQIIDFDKNTGIILNGKNGVYVVDISLETDTIRITEAKEAK